MSHSTVAVLFPPEDIEGRTLDKETVDGMLKYRMAYYDEEMQVPEYETVCYCAGILARKRACEAAEKEHGPLDDVRKAYHALPEDQRTDEQWDKMREAHCETEKRLLAADPERGAPDPECLSCKGTGRFMTSRNPNAKWDWWVLGGRWDGEIASTIDVPVTEDGLRTWLPPETYPSETPEGIRRNIKIVSDVLTRKPDWFPFAVLTPDTGWHERGEMGWWGIVGGDRKGSDWAPEAREILGRYPDHILVLVDYHI